MLVMALPLGDRPTSFRGSEVEVGEVVAELGVDGEVSDQAFLEEARLVEQQVQHYSGIAFFAEFGMSKGKRTSYLDLGSS